MTETLYESLARMVLTTTNDLETVFERREPDLRAAQIRGYIFRRGSPSCGLHRVKRYHDGRASRDGQGVFAQKIQARWPNVPCEEGGRLNDHRLRENFIQRVYTYDRWCRFLDGNPTVSDLMTFHAEHKYLVLSHNQGASRTLGRLVAEAEKPTLKETLAEYENIMMDALGTAASVKTQVNTLQHLQGFVKKHMSARDKTEFSSVVTNTEEALSRLITPLTLLRHYLDRWGSDWVKGQIYLDPYPEDLALRSHTRRMNLDPTLNGRVSVFNASQVNHDGAYVLYWMVSARRLSGIMRSRGAVAVQHARLPLSDL